MNYYRTFDDNLGLIYKTETDEEGYPAIVFVTANAIGTMTLELGYDTEDHRDTAFDAWDEEMCRAMQDSLNEFNVEEEITVQ